MNALLYFPGIVIVIMLATGLERAIRTVVLILEVQVPPMTDDSSNSRSFLLCLLQYNMRRVMYLKHSTLDERFYGSGL